MTKFIASTLTLLALATVAPAAHAEDIPNEGAGLLAEPGRVGLGLGGSTLTSGLTGKIYLSDALAAQANVGWWLGAGFSAGADLIFERAFFKNEDLSVQGYLGAGPAIGVFSIGTTANVFAVSGVAGAGLHLGVVPLELTAEIRPTVIVGNRTWGGFYFGGGGAIRYYF